MITGYEATLKLAIANINMIKKMRLDLPQNHRLGHTALSFVYFFLPCWNKDSSLVESQGKTVGERKKSISSS